MRHGKKHNHLGRQASHRQALLSNLAGSLILHKRIRTTLAKAKALRVYVEPIITKSKLNTTHSRRIAFSYLKNKDVAKELFDIVAPKVANRPGGYTRILKIGNRLGDNAEIAIIELVDFNELAPGKLASGGAAKKKTRRGGGKKTATEVVAPVVAPVVETPAAIFDAEEEAPVIVAPVAAPEVEVEASDADATTEETSAE